MLTPEHRSSPQAGGSKNPMGCYTTVVIANDTLDSLARDPDLGEKLVHASHRAVSRSERPYQVPGHNIWVIGNHDGQFNALFRVGTGVMEEVGAILPYDEYPDRLTKGAAIRCLRLLSKKLDRLLPDFTGRLLGQVADMMENKLVYKKKAKGS
jgi:hypothetical protein